MRPNATRHIRHWLMLLVALIQFDSCCGARACDALRLQSLTSDLDNNRPITEGQFALPASW
jgi:hypothetical protein